jgi:hypothetical protein
VRLLDNRIFRLLMMPTRASLKVASVAVQTFLRTVSRVVGSAVIKDIVGQVRNVCQRRVPADAGAQCFDVLAFECGDLTEVGEIVVEGGEAATWVDRPRFRR